MAWVLTLVSRFKAVKGLLLLLIMIMTNDTLRYGVSQNTLKTNMYH